LTPLGHQVMKAAEMSMTPQSRPAEIMAAKARELFVSVYAGVEGGKPTLLVASAILADAMAIPDVACEQEGIAPAVVSPAKITFCL
jgi:hypothetical protein